MGRRTAKARALDQAQRRVHVARRHAELCRERGSSGKQGGCPSLAGVQKQIAEELGVSQKTVCHDLKALGIEWQEQRVDYVQQQRELALAEVDRIASAAWDEWDRSKQAEATSVVREDDGSSESLRYRKDDPAKRVPGDPRYLAEIIRCIERKARIVGFDAPTKTEQINIPPEWLALLTPDELEQAGAGKIGAAAIAALVSPRLKAE